jgi:glutamine cyclotransferase
LTRTLLWLGLGLFAAILLIAGARAAVSGQESLRTFPTSAAGAAFASATPAEASTPTSTSRTAPTPPDVPATPIYSYRVIAEYPHDPGAWTQGLIYAGADRLYEGTGLRGQSSLRLVRLGERVPERIVELDPQYFGEGITRFGDRIFQLTWQEQTGFIYDADSLQPIDSFSYPPPGSDRHSEGWGLTHDGTRLIMSDGTNRLYFIDPQTMQFVDEIAVFDHEGPVVRLNELEYIEGEVWANIWLTNLVARIDPTTGRVKSYIDFSGLLTPAEQAGADVLNGIAYDPQTGRIFITGKYWPKLFQIELLIPASALHFRHYTPLLVHS